MGKKKVFLFLSSFFFLPFTSFVVAVKLCSEEKKERKKNKATGPFLICDTN